VAKWLRQWVVIPSFAGSSPVVRPQCTDLIKYYALNLEYRLSYSILRLS
jgi:hypothetical protein